MAIEQSNIDSSTLSFTGRIAGWSARHRWWVVGGSALAVFLAVFVLFTVETKTRDDGDGPGESGGAERLIDERFRGSEETPQEELPEFRTRTERLIFSNLSIEVDDPLFRSTVDGVIEILRDLPNVESAVSFYDTNIPDMASADRHAVVGQVVIQAERGKAFDIEVVADAVRDAANESSGFELGIISNRLIQDEADQILEEDFQRILFISLGFALIVLLLAFRAVVAAAIPLIMAIGAIFSALGVTTLISQVYPLVDLYAEMILLMGLAVGIDYSLFIVSRFRSERKLGRPKLEAISIASDTTGRAVFYAGITVVLSLTGLMLTNDFTFISLAAGAIVVVFLTIIASLTLMPALIAVLGDNINRLRVPIIGRDAKDNSGGGIWGAIADKVLAQPAIFATVAAAGLIAIALPFFSLNLGFNEGADALPDALESKRTLQLLEDHFSSSLTRPAWIVIDAPNVNSPDVEAATTKLIETLDSDTSFFGPFETQVNRDEDLMLIRVPVAGKIDDEVSVNAVKLLRNDILPIAFSGTTVRAALVAGATAESIDFEDKMLGSAVYVFAFVLGLAFLLMLVMFRSLVIPIKAIVLNLLSVGAAYGVLVMVFQWGWGISILGSEASGVIETWLPLFLFGILFGLSMDYHMLLLSRIKEAYDQGHSNDEAVSTGIKITAGQITSAAIIMVGVFGAFATSRILGLQQFGLGLAVAVFIDATIIRVILLPATMKLLGDRNWYLPNWLGWLPKISVEGGRGEPQFVPDAIPSDMDD